MDCQTARTFFSASQLAADDEERLAAHLASCAACADDEADPIGQLLRRTELPLAHPPPDFVANVLARLPQASPQALHAGAQRRVRLQIGAAAGLGLALGGLLVALPWLRQPSLAVAAGVGGLATEAGRMLLRFALVAKSLLTLSIWPLLVVLVGSAELLRRWWSQMEFGTVRRLLLPAAGLAMASVVIVGQLLGAAGGQQVRSVGAPLVIASDVRGDVASLLGDITVRGHVSGDVTTLGGSVHLAPGAVVDGSVLSGAGAVATDNVQIGGGVVDGLRPLVALAQVAPAPDKIDRQDLTRLGSIVGILMTLALASLWVMLQPQRIAAASRQLTAAPAKALGFGLAAAVVLGGLALGGSLVLAATVVGVVLIPVLLVVVHVPLVQGIATVGQALGRRITGQATPGGALWGIGIVTIVVVALGLLTPIASLTTFYLLGGLGLGALLLDGGWRGAAL